MCIRDRLQVAVRAEILWDGPDLAGFAGAQRLLRMQVLGALRRPGALALRWGEAQLSPCWRLPAFGPEAL